MHKCRNDHLRRSQQAEWSGRGRKRNALLAAVAKIQELPRLRRVAGAALSLTLEKRVREAVCSRSRAGVASRVDVAGEAGNVSATSRSGWAARELRAPNEKNASQIEGGRYGRGQRENGREEK